MPGGMDSFYPAAASGADRRGNAASPCTATGREILGDTPRRELFAFDIGVCASGWTAFLALPIAGAAGLPEAIMLTATSRPTSVRIHAGINCMVRITNDRSSSSLELTCPGTNARLVPFRTDKRKRRVSNAALQHAAQHRRYAGVARNDNTWKRSRQT